MQAKSLRPKSGKFKGKDNIEKKKCVYQYRTFQAENLDTFDQNRPANKTVIGV